MTVTLRQTGAPATARGAAAHVAATNAASARFFNDHADMVARACHAMATRYQQGGRLLVYGEGAQRSDVAHAVVEFVHPVIVGKRALPALALPAPEALDVLGRDRDILMLLCGGRPSGSEHALLARARARGMLALALTADTSAAGPGELADLHFAVPSDDPLVVQEAHEMLYHVLWELVHVFLDHGWGAA